MHTMIPELGAGVPAFLAKLWKLVEDPQTDDLICWSPNGKSFFIKNQAQFARELLPHYYKHNNMASFVRQLNMYGFHKKVSVELGGLKCDKDEMEFAHQFFVKGQPYLLEYIKRKIASSKTQDPAHAPIKPELMTRVLAEVRHMRGRQDTLDTRLSTMKHENEALWRELALLRQKHMKQQQIVNKLIHFLVAFVQPSRTGGLSVKRRYPLMIDDSSLSRKRSKLSKPQASPTGPVIHELDASEPDLDSEYIVAEMLENETPSIHSPQEHIEELIDDDNIETVEPAYSVNSKDEMVTRHEIDAKKKRVSKGKKRRKSKVPVKLLIPPLENGDKPREELHLLEMPAEKPSAIKSLSNKSVSSTKSIPMATMRSSKLAAMAANINKSPDAEEVSLEDDTETSDNDAEVSPALLKLEDILIVPEIIDHNSVQNDKNRTSKDTVNKELRQTAGGKSIWMTNKDEERNEAATSKLKHGQQDASGASTSSSKDLSLTCVTPSGLCETNYRSESTERMDNHLETMQNDLDNLRDILQGEGYNLDANTLLGVSIMNGLFGADDPMTFELPVNPELNPNCEDDNDHTGSVNRHPAGGELMAYNPASTLLDFDDDIFLGNASSSLSTPTPDLSGVNNLCTVDSSDPLGLGDSKASLLESLVTNSTNPKS
ncbi:Heat shock factor protein [Ooceraea biroi]|uniref:Heat shock factor protein n=1 Tax=Ooceraea biroi TaxID=2015173 RepID=A0A026WTP7_OOCBI|nr:Heat shock factor protein [Ooceraea biroi]